MSEFDNKDDAGEAGGTPDPITNLKAEFSRKQSNIEAKLQESQAALQAIMAKLEEKAKPAEPKPGKVSVFDDEEAYASSIEERVLTKVSKAQEVQSQYQSTAAQLYTQYPELNDTNSDIFKSTQEKLKGWTPEQLVKNPLLLKTAVYEAAAESGIKPKSKRSSESDDFALVGGSPRKPGKPKDEVPEDVVAIAQLMGRDTSDPKVMNRLKETMKRKNWGQYK
jgi:hypothetical protein